jgi:hypothetical protein
MTYTVKQKLARAAKHNAAREASFNKLMDEQEARRKEEAARRAAPLPDKTP